MRLAACCLFLFSGAVSPAAPVETVPSVDLNRYAGRWYEIARYPNRFQKQCASDTTATYTLRPDKKIDVVNACRKPGGEPKIANGTARLASSGGPPSKLKVTFFWPFSGDYWIIGLDPDYRWALVGDPDRKYLWILARTPTLDAGTYRAILDRARSQGFDPARLVATRHTPGGDVVQR